MNARRNLEAIHLLRHLLVALFVLICCIGMEARAEGDVTNGKRLYEQRCGGCHAVDSNKVGPMHQGVVGRKAGAVPGFAYSLALKNSSVIWNEKNLGLWLVDPEALIPGQRMGYRVINEQEREHLVAYLLTLKP